VGCGWATKHLPLIQTTKIHRHDPRYSLLYHGHAIDGFDGRHRSLIVGHDDELRVAKPLYQFKFILVLLFGLAFLDKLADEIKKLVPVAVVFRPVTFKVAPYYPGYIFGIKRLVSLMPEFFGDQYGKQIIYRPCINRAGMWCYFVPAQVNVIFCCSPIIQGRQFFYGIGQVGTEFEARYGLVTVRYLIEIPAEFVSNFKQCGPEIFHAITTHYIKHSADSEGLANIIYKKPFRVCCFQFIAAIYFPAATTGYPAEQVYFVYFCFDYHAYAKLGDF
jgi:hypothetical protein